MSNHDGNTDKSKLRGLAAVEGMLGGLGDLLEKLADVAEKAESVEREGSFNTKDGREGRFRVGFNVRTMQDAGGQREIKVEPFGDVQRDEAGNASVSDVREPPVDVFEEPDGLMVVVEMPGIPEDNATFEVNGDILTVEGENGPKRYRAEVLLPSPAEAVARVTSNNGVFEVRLSPAAQDEAA